jgi:hypothetical protein
MCSHSMSKALFIGISESNPVESSVFIQGILHRFRGSGTVSALT